MDFCPFRGPDAPHALIESIPGKKQTRKCADYADLLLEVPEEQTGGGAAHAVCASAQSEQERLAVAQISSLRHLFVERGVLFY